jgi:hypothetical protein
MDAFGRKTICTGDSTPYSVNVHVAASSMGHDTVAGIKVEAYPNDKSVGSFTKSTATTRSVAGAPAFATFTFKAGSKPGKTDLVFQGFIAGFEASVGYVSTNIPIAVVECQYQVSASLRFPADRSGGVPTPAIVIVVRPTKLQADPEGHILESAPVHWVSGVASVKLEGGTCTGTLKFAKDDEVLIEGDVGENGAVKLTFGFPSALGSWTGQCNGLAVPMGTLPYTITPPEVYLRSEGGVATIPARISASVADGSASFVLKKLKGG